jgi:hypothetical protein
MATPLTAREGMAMINERKATNTLIAAAVLGILAGATACAGTRTAASGQPTVPPTPPSASPADDKNACGSHPGSACAAPKGGATHE